MTILYQKAAWGPYFSLPNQPTVWILWRIARQFGQNAELKLMLWTANINGQLCCNGELCFQQRQIHLQRDYPSLSALFRFARPCAYKSWVSLRAPAARDSSQSLEIGIRLERRKERCMHKQQPPTDLAWRPCHQNHFQRGQTRQNSCIQLRELPTICFGQRLTCSLMYTVHQTLGCTQAFYEWSQHSTPFFSFINTVKNTMILPSYRNTPRERSFCWNQFHNSFATLFSLWRTYSNIYMSGREEKLADLDRAKRNNAERRRVSLQTYLSLNLLQTQVGIAT